MNEAGIMGTRSASETVILVRIRPRSRVIEWRCQSFRNNLLCFDFVRDVPFVVDAALEVSGSRMMARTPCDKRYEDDTTKHVELYPSNQSLLHTVGTSVTHWLDQHDREPEAESIAT